MSDRITDHDLPNGLKAADSKLVFDRMGFIGICVLGIHCRKMHLDLLHQQSGGVKATGFDFDTVASTLEVK